MNPDICAALGDDGERCGDRPKRPGDAGDEQHRCSKREQSGEAGGDSHRSDGLPQHAVQFGCRNADIDDAYWFAGGIEYRLIGRVEAPAEQDRRTLIGLAAAKFGLAGMIRSKLRPNRPLAIFLLYIRRSANELLRRIVVDEERRVAADIGNRAVDDPVVAEFRHPRNLDAPDHAIVKGDFRVREQFAEGKGKGSKVDIDIPLGTDVEIARQRPVTSSDQECGVDRNQQGSADYGLGSQI